MNLSWLPSLGMYVLGLAVIGFTFKKYLCKATPSSTQNTLEQLLKTEHEAQYTRAVALSPDQFIQVDFSSFPTVDQVDCVKKYQSLMNYSKLSMINMQGQTNLELKQMYGPQTLEAISQYEKNYYGFMDICIQYGKLLYEKGYCDEARQTLEQCLLYHCDVSKCYLLLIEIYKQQEDLVALSQLKPIIEKEMCDSPFLHKVLKML